MKSKRNILIVSVCVLLSVASLGFAVYVSMQDSVPKLNPQIIEKQTENMNLSKAQTVNQTLDGFTVTGTGTTTTPAAPAENSNSSASTESTVYKINYNLRIRKDPDYDAEEVGKYTKGDTATVTETKAGARNSIWGKVSEGHWICLKDDESEYCTKQ